MIGSMRCARATGHRRRAGGRGPRSHRARQLPAHPYPDIIASSLNADMHWMAVAMEAQDGP